MANNLMGPDNIIKLLSATDYDKIDHDDLRVWCHVHARYGLPTIELIDWLKTYIDGRTAIEIGSGSGDLAHHLGIRGTDDKTQDKPDVVLYYRLIRQPTIKYPSWVEKLDALDAIKQYRPQVVVASWVTHWIDPDQDVPVGGGSVYGVHEDQIVESGATYIFIGNMAVHRHKPILKLPHQELRLPFLRSRAADPSLDRVLLWNA